MTLAVLPLMSEVPGAPSSSPSVIEYVLARLSAIGVSDVFAVPGDDAFAVQDALVRSPAVRYVGCCNELDAGYAADGYARIRGVGALSTTYGVGELSAINAIAGAYAEHVPVFHLVGMPSVRARSVHHTLGDGELDLFRNMAESVVCASAVMTPENAVDETDRLISDALHDRRPVYMAFPSDLADQPIVGSPEPLRPPMSDHASLRSAIEAILAVLDRARSACILPGLLAVRAGARDHLQAFVDASGLPFATMFIDKSVLEEQQPAFIGMYDGKLMDEAVRDFVESCDVVVTVGTMMTDLGTGAFTSHLDRERTIDIRLHCTHVGPEVYRNVEMRDVLTELARRVTKRELRPAVRPSSLGVAAGRGRDPITVDALYPRWAGFLKPRDILVAETGTCSLGLAFALMPKGATFLNQTLWGSIGWATPAAFGAAVAAPDRRVVLVTGEGSHEMTAQEISQLGRRGLKVTVFVLNNSGYLIERLLCRNPESGYNDLASWRYSEIPHALGCDGWLTARVETCGELDKALKDAERAQGAAYIEVVTDKYAAPPLARRLRENLGTPHG